MKRATVILAAVSVVLTCGLSHGKNPTEAAKHLKCYDALIGTWRYEGPLLEDIPNIAKKETPFVFEFSWKRILDKSVVEENWSGEFQGGNKIGGKTLIGWNAADDEISYGAMDSTGGMGIGTTVFDKETKAFTYSGKGVSGVGGETKYTGVITRKSTDTITWRALERVGGFIEGPSLEYTFKKVKRGKRAKAAK